MTSTIIINLPGSQTIDVEPFFNGGILAQPNQFRGFVCLECVAFVHCFSTQPNSPKINFSHKFFFLLVSSSNETKQNKNV